jgi:hypothetical protein
VPETRSDPSQLTVAIGLIAVVASVAAAQRGDRASLAERVTQLTRDSPWKLIASVPVKFTTHHPQGMVKIGDTLFVSSVEIKVRTKRFPQPVNGLDRDAGEGIGHLFKFDLAGNLLADLVLGEGTIYHPGGIDFDGKHIWVPVAEYRPNSRSIVYRVDPQSMKAAEMLRFDDHVGGVACNTDDNTLHGVSWGSRRFYRWTLDGEGRITNRDAKPEALRTFNTSHYLDYQDCKYAGDRRMLCTGVTELRSTPVASAAPFRLGGLDLVDLRDGRPAHQVPVLLWTAGGVVMTQNPVWIDAVDSDPSRRGLRAYFMPEDDKSILYIYEVDAK